MKPQRRLVRKLQRMPSTLRMLLSIEWGQFRTRGMKGYIQFHARALRNRLSNKYPKALQIEPYGGCNIRCAMCFQGRMELPSDRNMMDLEIYKRIVDEMSPVTPRVYLFWRGEPMLHKNLGSMIHYAKAKGMYVFVSTNAVLLTEEKANEFIDSGLDFLLVGFDGASKASYEKMRRGAKFEQVSENIRRLIQIKHQRKALLPHVCLQLIVSAVNEHELTAFRQLSRDMGADSSIEKILDVYENFNNPKIQKALAPLFVKRPWSKYEEQDGKFRRSSRIVQCDMAKRMVVRADGQLNLCCYDLQGLYPIGSAKEGSLQDIWQSPKYIELRTQGQNRRLPLCHNCGAGIQR